MLTCGLSLADGGGALLHGAGEYVRQARASSASEIHAPGAAVAELNCWLLQEHWLPFGVKRKSRQPEFEQAGNRAPAQRATVGLTSRTRYHLHCDAAAKSGEHRVVSTETNAGWQGPGVVVLKGAVFGCGGRLAIIRTMQIRSL
jgi:hypothetical protein